MEVDTSFQHHRFLADFPPGAIAPEINAYLLMTSTLDPILATVKPPMVFRFGSYYGSLYWNAVAVFSRDCDCITQEHPLIASPSDRHTSANRIVAMIQAVISYSSKSLPDAVTPLITAMETIGYTGFDIALHPRAAACTDDNCLNVLAFQFSYDPKMMGHIVAKQILNYSVTDGFNQFGKDGNCTANCRPYADTSGYQPSMGPDRWVPLLEDDGKGYFVHQVNVAPNVGNTAKFRYLPEEERETRMTVPPEYTLDRYVEAQSIISTMATALVNETTRMEVECFDSKMLVINKVVQAFISKVTAEATTNGWRDVTLSNNSTVLSLERLAHFQMGLEAVVYDAAIIAWKSKITYDLIRPTTAIQRLNQNITTWAVGGIQTFHSSRFASYRRTQPHSEYVSGSSCIFLAICEYVIGYLQTILLIQDTTFPIKFEMLAGTSKTEPGVSPKEDLVLLYATIQEMVAVGGQSRVNGGMHFEGSVKAAQVICSGIGANAVRPVSLLY
jgi:hypothetical protein